MACPASPVWQFGLGDYRLECLLLEDVVGTVRVVENGEVLEEHQFPIGRMGDSEWQRPYEVAAQLYRVYYIRAISNVSAERNRLADEKVAAGGHSA